MEINVKIIREIFKFECLLLEMMNKRRIITVDTETKTLHIYIGKYHYYVELYFVLHIVMRASNREYYKLSR